ncbi:uncharacterized protein LOC133525327 [Cydia pomonella]|uniref:uncharacterized protein LOC133525327 n=1 Tax=Cydia pomonella TaxID=82600 RepID=UPI002ADD7F4D|nr:uncharacterized protein LOC133525327 [Cydia pomonella]
MQITQCNKKQKGRRFTDEEKIISLAIIKQSPKADRFLQQIFILPSRNTLNVQPGINVQIFDRIKDQVIITYYSNLFLGNVKGLVSKKRKAKPRPGTEEKGGEPSSRPQEGSKSKKRKATDSGEPPVKISRARESSSVEKRSLVSHRSLSTSSLEGDAFLKSLAKGVRDPEMRRAALEMLLAEADAGGGGSSAEKKSPVKPGTSTHLDYQKGMDHINGFVHLNKKTNNFADHALAFMVRGAIHKWQQPIAYYFCEGATKIEELRVILKTVIGAVIDTGLLPVAVVCDQGPGLPGGLEGPHGRDA